MTPRQLLARVISPLLRAAGIEGEYRPGPYILPISGGVLSAEAGQFSNWWQLGFSIEGWSNRSTMVEACVSAYSQTVAMCAGDHWRKTDLGGRTRISNSAASRILRHPNEYQSASDFLLNATRSLYMDGNAYALALRNDRFEIDELHLMEPRKCDAQIAEDGSVFYRLGGNAVVDARMRALGDAWWGERRNGVFYNLVPDRDVLHIRLHSDYRYPYPLRGLSPLVAAWGDLVTSDAINNYNANFYANQARPSAVLSTDLVLDKEQVQHLRDRWDEQSRGLNQGKTPILTAGLKVQPWAMGGRDTQIAELMKLSEEHIALAFRVPLQILGVATGGTRGSAEALMQSWIATGLGFALNHIEGSFDRLFELKGAPDEYIEFDTTALLRSQQKDRIDALVRGVQGGVYSPNEARASENLDRVPAGSEPRVQQQVVPLSFAGAMPSVPSAPGVPSAPPAAPAIPPPRPERENVQRELRNLRARAHEIARSRFTN